MDVVRLTNDRDFKQHLCWSPDGKKLLFTRLHGGKMGLWTMNAGGGELKPLLGQEAMPHFDGCWSPDGKRIVFVYDILQGTDGKLQINAVDADGADNKVLIPHKGLEESPRWSPDGQRLAFVSTRDGNQDIYVAEADGSNIKRLTTEIAADYCPAWSPDSKEIAFCSGRYGNLEICVMNADGSKLRRLTNDPAMDYWPVWSPDGRRLAFTSNRDGNYEIYVMDADGSEPCNLTQHPGQDNYATWSPDGKQLAFISDRNGGYDIYVTNVPGPTSLRGSRAMISPELLEILRCPMDPSRTRLSLEGERLICERCRLVFPIKDGFPVLVVEEAELPPGCQSLGQLPCQREAAAGKPGDKS